jgi:pentatricopeptide repeat protein
MYQPIENYGLIGNMRTAALVGRNGSIDWLCLPHFDSPSIFGAILDEEKGGRFAISPVDGNVAGRQLYWPESNVLITRFQSLDGVAEVIDFMPVTTDTSRDKGLQLVRKVTGLGGRLPLQVTCRPAFNYGRDSHETAIMKAGACFHTPKQSLGLATNVALSSDGKGIRAELSLAEGETAVFVLQEIEQGSDCGLPFTADEAESAFAETVGFWRRWLGRCTYAGRWREMVHRSVLALKLLTFEPSGAIVAAPTCSLPEIVGGVRNWDYRYVWVRDAAFTVYALMRVGFSQEAGRFMEWIHQRCQHANPDGSLQQMYTLNGEKDMPEQVLEHSEGYMGSGPVRIGNAAHTQLQLDIYGALMDSVYLYNKYGSPISYELWQNLRRTVNWVCENWQREDEGIWEFRSGPRHNVYSKLMCWVALDRGLRLANKRSFPADLDLWLTTRDEIYEQIMDKGWSAKRQAFVQSYGSEALDAANLIMPLVFFLSPTDPRMLKTVDAVNNSPSQGGLTSHGLVYRYDPEQSADGLEGTEGTFSICTFWLVEALTRAGRVEEARLLFEKMLSYANHLGLYAEQIGRCGEALGNFPQAFTHIALISAAYNLNKALDKKRG